ncbi:MAG TPA: MazG-like family protein [Oculatellaceae cyanobacterium]
MIETSKTRGDELAPIIEDVIVEIGRAERKFGLRRNHLPMLWMLILGEEYGEAQKAALEAYASEQYNNSIGLDVFHENYREELVQVAAMAICAIDSFDRNEGKR